MLPRSAPLTHRARVFRLINIVVDFPGFVPVVAELQIHYRPILELKEYEHHFLFEITRAKRVEELVPETES